MPISSSNYQYVCEFVHQKAGIVLGADKDYLVEARLTPLARTLGFSSIDETVNHARSAAGVITQKKIVEAMTTNETSFFRDLYPFDFLKNEILPKLFSTRAPGSKITIWSAASSTGQEAYSIAMLVREHFPDQVSRVKIVGTDLSNDVVQYAKDGAFHQIEVNRGLPAALLVKYFYRDGSKWRINDDIRSMVDFSIMNLLEAWKIYSADIVFIRNVLIYFDIATKEKILLKIASILPPDGSLILGGAETTFNITDAYDRIPSGKSGYYQKTKLNKLHKEAS